MPDQDFYGEVGEKLEGRLFETEVKAEKLESEVKSLKKVNETATGMIKQLPVSDVCPPF